MLWSIVLPFQITCFGIASGAIVLSSRTAFGRGRTRTFFIATGLAAVAFVPSCVGIELLIDTQRFGLFTYPNYQAVRDYHVQQDLPEAATDITVRKFSSGHDMKFKVKKAALDAWMDQVWAKWGEDSTIKRESSDTRKRVNDFPERFTELGWKASAGMVQYSGPTAPNGAGFEIWYSELEGIAYQRSSYW